MNFGKLCCGRFTIIDFLVTFCSFFGGRILAKPNETIMESISTKEVYMTEGQWHSWDGHTPAVFLRFVYLDVRLF
jgi:hypothetical protein